MIRIHEPNLIYDTTQHKALTLTTAIKRTTDINLK